MSNKHLVLVYGTLKRGHWNHCVIEKNGESRLVGEAVTTHKFVLTHGGIPFVTPVDAVPSFAKSAGHVRGELWEIDDVGLDACDGLEGHHDAYRRTPITAHILTNGRIDPTPVACEIYLYPTLAGRFVQSPDSEGILEWKRPRERFPKAAEA